MRIYQARQGHAHSIEYQDQKTTQRYTQVWMVELGDSDPPLMTECEVASLPGLPRAGWSTYRPRSGLVVPFAVCQSVTPKPLDRSLRLWQVVCQFELSGADQEEPVPDDMSPIDLRPRIEPFVESAEQVVYKDWDGTPILDPFNRLWDQPVKIMVPLPGVRVTRYVPTYDEADLAYWLQTTNLTPWRMQPADAWCIRSVSGSEVEVGNFRLGQLQFEIVSNPLELEVSIGGESPALRRIGWLDVRAARSVRYLNDDGQVELNTVNRIGEPESTWIDKDGKRSSVPYYFAYRKRVQRDFNQIVNFSS